MFNLINQAYNLTCKLFFSLQLNKTVVPVETFFRSKIKCVVSFLKKNMKVDIWVIFFKPQFNLNNNEESLCHQNNTAALWHYIIIIFIIITVKSLLKSFHLKHRPIRA